MASGYQCTWPNCGQVLSRPTSLRRHVQAAHDAGIERLVCETCFKTFSRKEFLRRHEQSHRGLGKQACPVCSRSFRSDYLAEHMGICARRTRLRVSKAPAIREVRWDGTANDRPMGVVDLDWSLQASVDSAHGTQPLLLGLVPEDLQVIQSVYSDASVWKQSLVQQAEKAIVDESMPQFDRFLRRMEQQDITVRQLDDFMMAMSTPEKPYRPLIDLACQHPVPPIIEALLTKGGNEAAWNDICISRLNGDEGRKVLRSLVIKGVITGRWGLDSSTPLLQAVKDRNVHRALSLLEEGARLDLDPVSSENSPVGIVIRKCHDRMFIALVQAAVEQGTSRMSLLQEAVKYGTPFMVRVLLTAGANPLEAFEKEPELHFALFTAARENGAGERGRWPCPEAAEKMRCLGIQQNTTVHTADLWTSDSGQSILALERDLWPQ